MYLESVYKAYRASADEVNWKQYNQNELFFKYIEHENDSLGENFFAGIVCRFWGYAARIYSQCNQHVPFEECYDCIIDAIRYVLKKRVWEDPNSSLYGDKAAPDKAMHLVMKRQKALMLAKKNAAKRYAEFNAISIDGIHEDYNDAAEGLFFDLDESKLTSLYIYISEFFENGKIFEGIILDTICYGHYSKYSDNKIATMLKRINEKDFEYYDNMYHISNEDYIRTLIEIQNTSIRLLSVKISRLLNKIKRDFK